jgi:hypothetical protein
MCAKWHTGLAVTGLALVHVVVFLAVSQVVRFGVVHPKTEPRNVCSAIRVLISYLPINVQERLPVLEVWVKSVNFGRKVWLKGFIEPNHPRALWSCASSLNKLKFVQFFWSFGATNRDGKSGQIYGVSNFKSWGFPSVEVDKFYLKGVRVVSDNREPANPEPRSLIQAELIPSRPEGLLKVLLGRSKGVLGDLLLSSNRGGVVFAGLPQGFLGQFHLLAGKIVGSDICEQNEQRQNVESTISVKPVQSVLWNWMFLPVSIVLGYIGIARIYRQRFVWGVLVIPCVAMFWHWLKYMFPVD